METQVKTVTVPGNEGIEARIHEEIVELNKNGFKVLKIESIDEKKEKIEGLAANIYYVEVPVEKVEELAPENESSPA